MARATATPTAFDDPDREPASTDLVEVIIMVDHVYLPIGTDGSVVAEWRDCPGPEIETPPGSGKFACVRPNPSPVRRKTRLHMPRDCAEFLSARDQAEILD